jgi:hypothetical protein
MGKRNHWHNKMDFCIFSIMIFFHPEHKSKVQRCRDAHRYSLIMNLSTEMLIGIALFRENQIIYLILSKAADNTWPAHRWPKAKSSSWLAAPVSYLRPSRRLATSRRRQHFWSLRFPVEWLADNAAPSCCFGPAQF